MDSTTGANSKEEADGRKDGADGAEERADDGASADGVGSHGADDTASTGVEGCDIHGPGGTGGEEEEESGADAADGKGEEKGTGGDAGFKYPILSMWVLQSPSGSGQEVSVIDVASPRKWEVSLAAVPVDKSGWRHLLEWLW